MFICSYFILVLGWEDLEPGKSPSPKKQVENGCPRNWLYRKLLVGTFLAIHQELSKIAASPASMIACVLPHHLCVTNLHNTISLPVSFLFLPQNRLQMLSAPLLPPYIHAFSPRGQSIVTLSC